MIQDTLKEQVANTYSILGNHDIYPHWDFAKGKGNPAAQSSAPFWKAWLTDE